MSFKRYFILFLLPVLFSCGSKDSQFSDKLIANPFVAKLYGDATKTFVLTAEPGSHIAWAGLDWSVDYKYFKIESMTVDGAPVANTTGTGSQLLYKDITVPPVPNFSSTVDGKKVVQILVQVSYSPLKAILSEDDPHKAFLLMAYDKPDLGTVRVELSGYTRGICSANNGETCNFSDAGTLTPVSYHLVDNTLDVFTCHPQTTIDGIANDSEHPNTRHDLVTITDPFVFYMAGDKSSVHIVRDDASGKTASVPLIHIVMPDAASLALKELDAQIADLQNITCPIDAEGGFLCNKPVKTTLASIVEVPLDVTTGTVHPQSDKCDFGEVAGDPGLLEGDDSILVIGWGVIDNDLAGSYLGAVIIVKLNLQKD